MNAMTAFALTHQLAIMAAAGILASLGAVLHVRDTRRAERAAGRRPS